MLRRPAIATTAGSAAGPVPFTPAMIFRCAGQIRIHTLAAMTVPKSPPTWMNVARPDMKSEHAKANTAVSTKETIIPVVSFFMFFQRTS